MNRIFLLVFLGLSVPLQASVYIEKLDKEQSKLIKQEMEEAPTSTAVGGSRSGNLRSDKEIDEKEQHDLEKQRQLYENDGTYRRGL